MELLIKLKHENKMGWLTTSPRLELETGHLEESFSPQGRHTYLDYRLTLVLGREEENREQISCLEFG